MSVFDTVCAILVFGKAPSTRHASDLASLGGYAARNAKIGYGKKFQKQNRSPPDTNVGQPGSD